MRRFWRIATGRTLPDAALAVLFGQVGDRPAEADTAEQLARLLGNVGMARSDGSSYAPRRKASRHQDDV
jgi:hypothetical protein